MQFLQYNKKFVLLAFLLTLVGFLSVNVSPASAWTAIDIEKYTNGHDADTPEEAPTLQVGDPVVWTYVVTNTSNGPGRTLEVVVIDDQGVEVVCPKSQLEVGESMTCYGYGTVEPGWYTNIGTVVGTDIRGGTVTDSDPSNYHAEEPPSGGGQGCTPGYWKQDHHFDSWVGYSPDDLYADVFGVDYDGTLLDALKAGGGKEKALGRHSVAALLNAASGDVDYLYSEAEIISMVQDAFASGDFNGVKDLFEAQNEAGCPLD